MNGLNDGQLYFAVRARLYAGGKLIRAALGEKERESAPFTPDSISDYVLGRRSSAPGDATGRVFAQTHAYVKLRNALISVEEIRRERILLFIGKGKTGTNFIS